MVTPSDVRRSRYVLLVTLSPFENNSQNVETTANTLAATLALLGCHQVEQENIYQSIRKVLGDRQPVCTPMHQNFHCTKLLLDIQ